MDGVLQTMVNEKIGPGERARSFVQLFCDTVKASSGVAYRTYPECLSEALRVMGAGRGTKVAVSPLSPAVYRSVIEGVGAEMVLVDIDRDTGCPNDSLVQASGADILMLYENFGTLPARFNEQTTYAESCDYSGVRIIEDISESIGSRIKDELYAGCLGQVVVCALEDECVVSAGGGAVLAVRGDYANSLRGKRPSKYLSMPDMNAALGLVQLLNLEDNLGKRRDILKVYQQSLSKSGRRQFGLTLADFESNASGFAVQLDSKPDEAVKFAAKYEVPARMAFSDCLLKDYEGDPFESVPVASSFYFRAVSFPLYTFLYKSEIESISKVIAHLP